MNYLIVGLGNIGDEYARTRHNIGFRVVDALAEAGGVQFEDKRYGFVATLKVKNQTLTLLSIMPQMVCGASRQMQKM